MDECRDCRLQSRFLERRAEEHKARQKEAWERAERAMRRAKGREMWGSDYEDRADYIPPSPTWSEEMDMLQAEASAYMNSPKAND